MAATQGGLTVGSIASRTGDRKLQRAEGLCPFLDVNQFHHKALLVHQRDGAQAIADAMKAVNCSQIARIWECIGGLRWHRVTSIWPCPKEQSAGRDSFVLVRAKRADSKDLDSLGNAIRKCSYAYSVIEDPSFKKCRNIAILGQTAEDRHILRGYVAVEE